MREAGRGRAAGSLRELLAEAGVAINGNSPWDLQVFDAVFYRLMASAGSFRSRQGQLWQLVLTKRERVSSYHSVR